MRINFSKFEFLRVFMCIMVICLCTFSALPAVAANADIDVQGMSDMSKFDPSNVPTPEGDVIKIGIVSIFSGAGAANGEYEWLRANWVAHDINQKGGILVDGKKKKLQFLKGDSKGSPVGTRKICEKLILQDGCKVLIGTNGSHNGAVMAQMAKKHKVIFLNIAANSDYLMDADHFNKYTFMTAQRNSAVCKAGAYYCSQYRKEKKYYVICQDYSFGHELGEYFIEGLKEYCPGTTVVGEEYHPLMAKDFTPYVTKIKASGAEMIFTGDWIPDSSNLLKTCRAMGVNIPILNPYLNDPNSMIAIGVEGTKNLVNISSMQGRIITADDEKFFNEWRTAWENTWTVPYNTPSYQYCGGVTAERTFAIYWLASVLERAGTMDIDKIIDVWEGDTFKTTVAVWTMRADDHTRTSDMFVSEYVPPEEQKVSMTIPPYYWYKDTCSQGEIITIPEKYCTPILDEKLKGRSKKNQ